MNSSLREVDFFNSDECSFTIGNNILKININKIVFPFIQCHVYHFDCFVCMFTDLRSTSNDNSTQPFHCSCHALIFTYLFVIIQTMFINANN